MHLNMEGTKHEKAVLVILSYVVGFTAGFITFGLTLGSTYSTIESTPLPNMVLETGIEDLAPEPEITSNNIEPENVGDEELVSGENVLYKDGRLMANMNGASVLLSAQLATIDPETAKNFADQGVHEIIPNFAASPTGDYIYYCEQHTTEDSCIHFMYSVNSQMINYVTVDGIKLVTTAAVAKLAQWTQSGLEINGATSVSTDTPWKLVSAQ